MNIAHLSGRTERSINGPHLVQILPFPKRVRVPMGDHRKTLCIRRGMNTVTISQPLTTTQLSKLLQIPVRTLEDWRTNNIGPKYWHAGKRVRYSPGDAQEWIDAQRAVKKAA